MSGFERVYPDNLHGKRYKAITVALILDNPHLAVEALEKHTGNGWQLMSAYFTDKPGDAKLVAFFAKS